MLRAIYPSFAGLLLGVLQTGLYFQLSFTLSSSFGTFLLVTLSWLLGSAIGVLYLAHTHIAFRSTLILALVMYFVCSGFLILLPFETQLWPLYASLIVVIGFFPGVFFARISGIYTASALFFQENNGFIIGIILSTLLFMLWGRIVLWSIPLLIGSYIYVFRIQAVR